MSNYVSKNQKQTIFWPDKLYTQLVNPTRQNNVDQQIIDINLIRKYKENLRINQYTSKMKKLISALGADKQSKAQQLEYNSCDMIKLSKGKFYSSIWILDAENTNTNTLDDDFDTKFIQVVKNLVQKKFQNSKYVEQSQNLFQQIINELHLNLQDVPTQLAKLILIQTATSKISDMYIGQMKNYLKNLQSIIDIRIRKLKRKQKKSDLSEFDKIIHDKKFIKTKQQSMYIDQERDQKIHIHRKQNRIKSGKILEGQSKKSYGTMNSGSNQNQSGSGRKSAGSQSRSGQGNALTVLLNNKDIKHKKEHNIDKFQKTINQSYNFSAIMSNSVSVKQRTVKKSSQTQNRNVNQTTDGFINVDSLKKQPLDDSKEEAFIFHRPKKSKKLHF